MHRVQLTTFLKLLAQSTQEKSKSYRKYDDGGGHDFYHSFKSAARDLTVRGREFDEASKRMDALSPGPERERNLEALQNFKCWLEKRNGSFFHPPEGLFESPSGNLGVILKPEFGQVYKKKRQVIALWCTRGVKLTPTAAGVGIYMMQSKLKVGEYADCEFCILDLVEMRLLGPANIPNYVHGLLSIEFAVADGFFKQDDAA